MKQYYNVDKILILKFWIWFFFKFQNELNLYKFTLTGWTLALLTFICIIANFAIIVVATCTCSWKTKVIDCVTEKWFNIGYHMYFIQSSKAGYIINLKGYSYKKINFDPFGCQQYHHLIDFHLYCCHHCCFYMQLKIKKKLMIRIKNNHFGIQDINVWNWIVSEKSVIVFFVHEMHIYLLYNTWNC